MTDKKHGKECWCEKCLHKYHGVEPVINGPERWWDPIMGDMRTYSWDPHIVDEKGVK